MKKIMFGNSLMLLGIAIMILAGLKVIYVGTLWVSFLLIIVGFVIFYTIKFKRVFDRSLFWYKAINTCITVIPFRMVEQRNE